MTIKTTAVFFCLSSSRSTAHSTLYSGNRAFPVAGANMWNDLLLHVTSAQSLAVFRQRFKTFLFSRSYPDILVSCDLYLPRHTKWAWQVIFWSRERCTVSAPLRDMCPVSVCLQILNSFIISGMDEATHFTFGNIFLFSKHLWWFYCILSSPF